MNAFRHLTFCLLLSALPTVLQATPKTIRLSYHYAPDGTLAGKSVNGRRLDYTQDARGQLIAAAWADGAKAEQHRFDPAGNRLAKTVDGETTRYTYDDANQLVSSVAPDGSVTRFRHDAAGRLVHAGDVAYRHDAWGRVTEIVRAGVTAARLEYGIDGQLSRITRSDGTVEEFVWDGLALVWRGGVAYVNEPAPTGGNPVLAGDAPILTDILGSSVAIAGDIIDMSAFGETARHDAFFTGKPYVEGLGYVFLLRNYCPQLGRWSAADPLGYPDGWNSLAYGNNAPSWGVDFLGGTWVKVGTFNGNTIYDWPTPPEVGYDSIELAKQALDPYISNYQSEIIAALKSSLPSEPPHMVTMNSWDFSYLPRPMVGGNSKWYIARLTISYIYTVHKKEE